MAQERIASGSHPEVGETVPDGLKGAVVDGTGVAAGTVLAERYEIRELIGRGGMGLVFTAHDRVLGIAVAIKVLRPDYAGERRWAERLAREVKLARQIQHPNVCRVFDFEQAEGRVFLVMELAGNGTLRDEIESGALAARPLEARLADARAIADGLAAIHDAGIIHRDLSPQNLLRMSDGRLVISDFGLAIDVFASGTSARGGTVAYMAPELTRGGPASFAADVWSLGLVLHEVVFGERPRWRDRGGGALLVPELGRRLARPERRVLEVCRACTQADPAARPATANPVAGWLVHGLGWRRGRRGSSRGRRWQVLMSTAALAAVGALIAGGVRGRRPPHSSPGPVAEEIPYIVPVGEPEDWSDKALVLTTTPERIRCLRTLPDGHTLRFVWGNPGKPVLAEDLDIDTGRRNPSPIVAESYAEGCPDLSVHGHLLYPGHTRDGRAYAFLSERPDGRYAQPMVQTAEPSMDSEPRWVSGGDVFSFEIDDKHEGVFSPSSGRITAIPDFSLEHVFTSLRGQSTSGLVVGRVEDDWSVVIALLSWPSLARNDRFRLPDDVLDVVTEQPNVVYYSTKWLEGRSELIAVNLGSRRSRRLGRLGQIDVIRYPAFVSTGLVFAAIHVESNVAIRQSSGQLVQITSDGGFGAASRCGEDIIASMLTGDREVVRLDRRGHVIRTYPEARGFIAPACSLDGTAMYAYDPSPPMGIASCVNGRCQRLMNTPMANVAVSPDGTRLLLASVGDRGPVIQWISTAGGAVHDVIYVETICHAGWSGDDTAWVPRRHSADLAWEEINVDSGRPTGRTRPGSHDCMEGRPDPISPVDPDVRVITTERSKIRLIPRRSLALPGAP